MQSADFLSAVFFYLKVGENLNQNWIVENLNNAFSTWNGKLGELWGLVTTGPQTFKGGAVWSVMQTLHNGMVGIGYALVVLFFAISLCKNTMNFHELKRPEAAIHYFLRFVAAKALVGYGMDIMLNVFSICNGIVTDMADSMGGISEAMVSLPAEMQTAIENVGFLASIPLWLVTILGSLFITVLALRIFATGSMQAFAQPTNVDMSNRLICFNIQSLGEQLKPVAMLSMLEYINTAVMSNERNDPKAATWVYFDEIYLLLRDSLSANFLYTSWKRFRKYNAYATGITQNVQDCLTNDTAYAMLANSEFVVMLRQTKDIDSVVELYGLSEPQRKYLLLAQPGEGIIKMGNSLIPFNNPQPKDTKTYKLLTTKPGEME